VDPRSAASRRADRPLRRSLDACFAEGLLAEVVGASAGGNVLTAWALHVGLPAAWVGALASLPFVAQALHLPAAWVTVAYGRRRVSILANLAARLCWAALPLALLADGVPSHVLLVGIAAISSAISIVGVNAWVAWVGDLVPARLRGRYFGRRMAATTFANTTTALGAGVLLDRAEAIGAVGYALGGLALLASLTGIACAVLMTLQHEPGGEVRSRVISFEGAKAPLRDADGRAMAAWQLGWNAAVGMAAAYFGLHLLTNVGQGFSALALYTTTVALVRVAGNARLWGPVMDRVGARRVLAFTSLGLAFAPVFWLFVSPTRLWVVAIEAVWSGLLSGGHQLSAFALPLAIAPRAERPWWLAAFSTAAGVGFGLGAAVGAAMVAVLPDRVELGGFFLADLQVVFAVAAIARLGGGLLALRLVPARGPALAT
jgi:MFS family permease